MIGIIFDLDGTLWDSTKHISDAWNEVFKCNNIPIHVTSKTIKQLLGKTNNEIMEQMFFNLSKDKKIKLMKQCDLSKYFR